MKHYEERTDPCPHPGCTRRIRIAITSRGVIRVYHGEDALCEGQISVLPGPGDPPEEDYERVLQAFGVLVGDAIAEAHWKMAHGF